MKCRKCGTMLDKKNVSVLKLSGKPYVGHTCKKCGTIYDLISGKILNHEDGDPAFIWEPFTK